MSWLYVGNEEAKIAEQKSFFAGESCDLRRSLTFSQAASIIGTLYQYISKAGGEIKIHRLD
jgi:hypothetical protein